MAKKEFSLPEVIKDKMYEFVLTGDNRPVNYGIGAECTISDPSRGERHIRYVPGWESIFVDEQPDIEERLVPKVDINFSRGSLRVPGVKRQLVQYLLLHDKNEENEFSITKMGYFKLLDNTGAYRDRKDLILNKSKAITMATNADFDTVMPYAKVLGISTAKIPGETQDAFEERVRSLFLDKADSEPADFIKGFEDPNHKREYDIMLGFEQGLISDAVRDREVVWVKSGEKIVSLPSSGAKVIKFMADYTHSKEGGEFYGQLKKQIKY